MTPRQALVAVIGNVLLWCVAIAVAARTPPPPAPAPKAAPAPSRAATLSELDAMGRRMVAYDRIAK